MMHPKNKALEIVILQVWQEKIDFPPPYKL